MNKKYIRVCSVFYIEGASHFPKLEQSDQFNPTLMKALKLVK
ncbi:hypothetical protein [Vibrio coralliirubri]|nr:hypothetical protein [Vibrio coralliirubri]